MKFTLLIVSLIVFSSTPMWGQEYIAVINDQVTEGEATQRAITNAVLGRKTTWKQAPVVLILSREQSGRDAIKHLTGRDHDRLLRGWKRLTFSGNGSMPTVVDTNQQAIELVTKTRGAIALIGKGAVNSNRDNIYTLALE